TVHHFPADHRFQQISLFIQRCFSEMGSSRDVVGPLCSALSYPLGGDDRRTKSPGHLVNNRNRKSTVKKRICVSSFAIDLVAGGWNPNRGFHGGKRLRFETTFAL